MGAYSAGPNSTDVPITATPFLSYVPVEHGRADIALNLMSLSIFSASRHGKLRIRVQIEDAWLLQV